MSDQPPERIYRVDYPRSEGPYWVPDATVHENSKATVTEYQRVQHEPHDPADSPVVGHIVNALGQSRSEGAAELRARLTMQLVTGIYHAGMTEGEIESCVRQSAYVANAVIKECREGWDD